MPDSLLELVFLAGLISICAGVGLVYLPAAYIVGGLAAIAYAVIEMRERTR